jgi:hypothetical protein
VGSVIITFRIGGEDAVKLKPEFSPLFDVKDMINLAVTEIYVKMTIDGESYDPFSAETLKVLTTDTSFVSPRTRLSMLLAENILFLKRISSKTHSRRRGYYYSK